MGRLKSSGRLPGFNGRRLLRNWLLPLILTALIILILHPGVKADPAPTTDELVAYLAKHNLDLGAQVVNGYEQIYYAYNGQQVFITGTAYNHVYQAASGPYVTWEGVFGSGGQIYIYNVLTGAEVQLSSHGTNSEPSIFSNQVVWRNWDGQHWQIYYYNGSTVQQITSGNSSSVRPSTNGQKIIYAQQVATNDWKAQVYDIASGQTSSLREGNEASTAYPAFDASGNIVTAFVQD